MKDRSAINSTTHSEEALWGAARKSRKGWRGGKRRSKSVLETDAEEQSASEEEEETRNESEFTLVE